MARHVPPHADPAADAAALLRRIGFATLMLALPVAALVARRAVVVLAPVGVALLVIAAALDGENRRAAKSARALTGSLGVLAGALFLAWCALSLLWTPFTGAASERLVNVFATVGLGLAGYMALPERMRSANLYLVTLGAALAAVTAMLLSILSWRSLVALDIEQQTVERGLMVLVMTTWPAVGWLRSRERDLQALLLAIAAAVATILGPGPFAFAALGVGAVTFALTASAPSLGVRATAFAMAGALALAPLLPLVATPLAGILSDAQAAQSLAHWRDIVVAEPIRLVTGHGFETALRGRSLGLLAAEVPRTVLFDIWYELGMVGAFSAAVALYCAAMGAGRGHPALVPGSMAAFASAFTFACLSIGMTQMWWVTTLIVVALIFIAAERGQFRTTRPKAILLRLVRR